MSELLSPRDQTRLYGHEEAAASFIKAWDSGRLPHAWLISGAAGIGKATFAFHLARWIMASDRPANSVTLPASHHLYRQVSAATAPGLLVVEPIEREKTGGTYTISVTQVRGGYDDREGIKQNFKGLYEFFQHSSAGDGWRIVIIDQVDQLNENAQNAVLKILEEPPARALLLLTTSQPGKLLPTIRSRCRQLALKPLSPAEMAKAARELGLNADASLLQAAQGSLGELERLSTLKVGTIGAQLDGLLAGLPQLDWQKLHELATLIGRKDAEPLFDFTMELLQLKLLEKFTQKPAGVLGAGEIARQIAAVKYAHLDRTASLIEIFNTLQKIMASATRAA